MGSGNAETRAALRCRPTLSERRSLPFALVLAAAMGVCAPSIARGWDDVPAADWREAARPDSGGRDALVLLEQGDAWDRQGEFRFTLFRRIRVFTAEGREFAHVDVDLAPQWRLSDLRARSVRSDGTTTELSQDQVIRTTIEKSGDREWTRSSFVVPGVEPGAMVEYAYTLSGKYAQSWAWPWSFQNGCYTRESRFTWHPSEWIAGTDVQAQWVVRRLLPSRVEIDARPSATAPTEIAFRVVAIPGYRSEPRTPPPADASPHILTFYSRRLANVTGYWSFWKRAMQAVSASYGVDLGPLEPVVREARANEPDADRALAKVHRWLQTHVRSISERSWSERQAGPLKVRRDVVSGRFPDPFFPGRDIDVGFPVLAPLNPKSPITSLLDRGWGTSYEIDAAFAAAARALGFDACVAFVGDRREEPFDIEVLGRWPLETLAAVRSRSGKWRFYHPASLFSPYGSAPWYLRGGKALLSGENADLFATIHPEDGVDATARWSLDLNLDGSGSLKGRVMGALEGEASRRVRSALWQIDPNHWSDSLGTLVAGGDNHILDFHRPDLSGHPDSVLALEAVAHYHAIAPVAGHTMTLSLDGLAPWRIHESFLARSRTQPVFLEYPRSQSITVDIHLPSGTTVEALPSGRQFENSIGSWSTTWSRTGDGIRWVREARLPLAEVPTTLYADVQEWFDGIGVADGDAILVRWP